MLENLDYIKENGIELFLDKEKQKWKCTKCKGIVTVEEHLVNGGLGEACASLLMQAGISIPFKIAAIPDEYTMTGSQMDIFKSYGLTAEGLSDTAMRLNVIK